MHKTLLIGSGNTKKADELRVLLEGLPWTVQSLAGFPPVPEPEEDGDTFEANAVKKARYYSDTLGLPCLADDSGLVVDVLDGEPGIFSARYAGDACDDAANVAKLLDALAEFSWHERTARFVCCAVYVEPGGDPHIETGVCEGKISAEPFGRNGFGYDPVFVPDGHEQTFAEMDPERKHALSHRGRALEKMRLFLESLR
jgi:XTP/dITP diphosphohydrolase